MRQNLTWKVVLVLVLVGLAGAVVFFGMKDIKLGFDLKGGVELRYKVEGVLTPEQEKGKSAEERAKLRSELSTKVNETVDVIRKRLDPDGKIQPDIRPESGGEIVIRLQGLTETRVAQIKRLVEDMGILEFRTVVPDSEYEKLSEEERKTVKRMPLLHKATPQNAEFIEEVYIQRQDKYNITGKDIKEVYPTQDEMGRRVVGFTLYPNGADLFSKLTNDLAEAGTEERPRRLAILLNGTLQSAPQVKYRIDGGQAVIEGIDASLINDTIAILKAGSLPTRLLYESEVFIGPELGADSLARGRNAVVLSVIFVLAFMCIYYAGSGFIADFAVLLNLLFIMAVILISGSVLTLPGIAGIVLTVGMSVDANVLIYERIREERAAGKVLRFAIKNGYERALLTIVDANLTTLITAIVLWIFLTGPVRWFAVTLSIGILSSMFTSLFVTRLVFDLLAGAGMVKNLRMMKLFSHPNLRFVRWAPTWIIISLVAIVIGMTAFVLRGKENLGIEFTSGTAAQLTLEKEMRIDDVRSAIFDLGYDNAQVVIATRDAMEVGAIVSNQFIFRIPQKSAGEDAAARQQVLDRIQERFIDNVPKRQVLVKVETTSAITDKDDPFVGGRFVNIGFWSTEQTAPELKPPVSPEPEKSVEPTAADPEKPVQEGGESPKPTEQNAGTEKPSETAVEAPEKGGEETAAKTAEPVLEEINLKREVIREALEKAGLGKVELVPLEDRESYSSMQFKTTESSEEKVVKAVTTPGLITVPRAFSYVQFVGPAQAHKMVLNAFYAILLSMLCIVIYVGFRFGNVRYGLAAIAALAHDVLITLGAIAVASYLAGTFLGDVLRLDQVEIDLNVVAAILTIIGYSLNDTIVVFDRIRENRGRRKDVNGELIDRSVNQTLSRTVLTSFTTLLVCVTLYLVAGRQLHGLAFCLTVGILVGTYSSIFIASPLLIVTHMGLSEGEEKPSEEVSKSV